MNLVCYPYFTIPTAILNKQWLIISENGNTGRPLVGFAMFNEYYINPAGSHFGGQLATTVHEILHALSFHPALFQIYPNNSSGETYVFQDGAGKWKMRGDNVLNEIRTHFGCSTADGGTVSLLY